MGTPAHSWEKCNTLWNFLKQLDTETPQDPVIPLVGIDPEELKSGSQRDVGNPTHPCSQGMGTTQMFISRQMDKRDVSHARHGMFVAVLKEEILPCAAIRMNLKDMTLSEMSQS